VTLSRNPKLNLDLLNWNKLILLYGPPGSGKTSLIMALAQKLSIRLGSRFSEGRLIEISSQSMHSRWFGQSGRLVSRMFDEILAVAEQDDQCLVCVMIDEIESLTASREKATQGNECNDALRVGFDYPVPTTPSYSLLYRQPIKYSQAWTVFVLDQMCLSSQRVTYSMLLILHFSIEQTSSS